MVEVVIIILFFRLLFLIKLNKDIFSQLIMINSLDNNTIRYLFNHKIDLHQVDGFNLLNNQVIHKVNFTR